MPSFLSTIITFIIILDGFGNIPFFLTLLNSLTPKKRKLVILREMVFALFILVFFLFLGKYVLSALHISEPALTISGGLILFLITIRLIFPQDYHKFNENDDAPMIVPLAVPLVSGPSSIAMTILYSTKYPEKIFTWLLAVSIAWLFTTVVLLLSDFLNKILGHRMLKAIERLMGIILSTVAVQMFLTGIKEFINIFVK
ncbi:MAG: MarC family protein [Spirochaetes bacterium]|nr:MarC family protein [Spirochaetota bacterium]